MLKKSIHGLFDPDLSSLCSPGCARKPVFAFHGEPAQREEGPPDLPLDPLRPWSSPYGRALARPISLWRNCQPAKQKARFLLCSIFQTFSCLKNDAARPAAP